MPTLIFPVLSCGDGDDHIWSQHCSIHSFDTLWRYKKYLAHQFLVTNSFANIQVFIEIIKIILSLFFFSFSIFMNMMMLC